MVFQWSLSDSKSSQVSRTLLSVLASLNNTVVWMDSSHPLISKSSSPCTDPFVTVPSTPITISITVTFMFHCFFSPFVRSKYFCFIIIIIIIYSFRVFHISVSLSDSKSSPVSRIFLSLLAVLDNTVVWMVATRPPTYKSSNPFNSPLLSGLLLSLL